MKRTAFARKTPAPRPPRERAPLVLVPRPADAPRAVMARANVKPKPAPKEGHYENDAWRRAVASLPCVLCGKHGETQAAHPNHIGKGMSMKAPDCYCVPLCVACHREFDQGADYTKAERRDAMNAWILLTLRELAQRGLIVPTGKAA